MNPPRPTGFPSKRRTGEPSFRHLIISQCSRHTALSTAAADVLGVRTVPGYGRSDAARLAEILAVPAVEVAPTFILTWNPDKYLWAEHGYERAVQITTAGAPWHESWSLGVRSGGINVGDRAFLLRQRRDRGLVASGVFTSSLEVDEHWDVILDARDRVSVEDLKVAVPDVKWDRIQASGVSLSSSAARTLTDLWLSHTGTLIFHSADEPRGLDGQTFPEGALTRVEVDRYERDPRARKTCLEHWGYRCAVCNFSFEDRYGPRGQNFIHVHHTVELSLAMPGYQVDPVKDLGQSARTATPGSTPVARRCQ
jgi:5-methylcytosine-specific restriction protein A